MSKKRSFGNRETVRTYDAFGRLSSEQYSDNKEISYRYDLDGRILEAKSPDGTISYTYDGNGQLSTVMDLSAKETVSYSYDKSGLKTSMKRGGTVVRYAYGKNRELVRVTEEGGADIQFTYDIASGD